MARQENLTVVKAGLNRQRTKGAALKDTLFELLNGYVTTEKTVRVRPGTLLTDTLTTGTVGLVAFDGGFHVFASAAVAGLPSNYTLHILHAPDGENLSKIHFAAPFLGLLYVSAEFADGDIFHFWLRTGNTWVADTNYAFNELAQPAAPTAFVYRATRNGDANVLWSEGAPRALNDKVEPTTQNGFYFEVNQIFGAKAISGTVEPDWGDAADGQLFREYVDGTEIPSTPTPHEPPEDNTPPMDVRDRYWERTTGGRPESKE